MKVMRNLNLYYSAKEGYRDGSPTEEYEKVRFSGLLGRYRHYRERKAVSSLVEMLPEAVSIADCPCGNGRWWPLLATRARRIIALDVSPGMLRHARKKIANFNIEIEICEGEAENLSLPNSSVDYVFSHALTKHMPIPIQYKVLAEFSRVAASGVVCSFGIFSHVAYEFWRHRHLRESYPVFSEELEWMARAANLRIRTMRKCTTPIGVEHTVLFDKLN
jgi:ubiquinone/menaquinone biosynthesis C-methylase UbiE